MIHMRSVFAFLFTAVSVLQAEITVQALRLDQPVTIDGVLSETVWKIAPATTGFLQLQPVEGAPATQQTFVRIAYDDNALYVGADMMDSSPDSIVARLNRRDNTDNEDLFFLGIDSYHDHRSGYYFGLTAGGTLIDGVHYNDDWTDDTWDGVWEGRVHRDGRGWTAEMRIPFSQLRFRKQEKYIWGINFRRDISRKNEQSFLVYTPKNSSGVVSRFAELIGIEHIRPARHIEILPYSRIKAAYTHPDAGDPFHKKSDYSPDVGLDVKAGLGNNLTLDLTANPDFGQVEVDPAVVNLGDVETYYDEKRPFFIEGSSIFNFGQGGANSYWSFNWSGPSFFYSRRIGRSPQGSKPNNDYSDIPEGAHILGAAKVSGKLPGNWNLGTVHAVTRKEMGRFSMDGNTFKSEVEPLTYYGVFRAQKEINKARQGIGLLSTLTARRFDDQRIRQDMNDDALVVGLDGWTFLDSSKTWVLAGWLGASRLTGSVDRMVNLQRSSRHYFQRPDADHVSVDSSATSLSGAAGRFVFNKQKGNVVFNSAFGFISPGFDLNDMGFLNRADMINAHAGGGYRWTKPGKWYREAGLLGAVFQNADFGMHTTWKGVWADNWIQFLNYMYLEWAVAYNPKTTSAFRTRGGPLTLNPPGREIDVWTSTDSRKPFVLNTFGYIYRCNSKEWSRAIEATLQWKPRSNISVSLGPRVDWNDEYAMWVDAFDDPTADRTYGRRYVFAEMQQKEIKANFRLNWTFTPKLSLQLFMQPLLSHGDYEAFKELDKPNSYDFNIYSGSQIIRSNGEYEIDPDGPGPAKSFGFDNPDFNKKSLRGNAVLRWEYKPGSTLYLVWTQSRWNEDYEEPFSYHRSVHQLLDTPADNIFMVKATYWWSL